MSVKDRMAADPVCGMKVDIGVGLPGLEPGTSSLSEKRDTFPRSSWPCKLPANKGNWSMTLSLTFQEIYSGCCTVAAHRGQKDHLRFRPLERQVALQKRLCFGLAGKGV
jgi:hypothetical protein